MLYVLLSFSAALDAVQRGEVTVNDLETAIFCFRCDRSWALAPVPESIIAEHRHYQKEAIKKETVLIVQNAFVEGEKSGRVIARRKYNPRELHLELNKLLTKLGALPMREEMPPVYENEFLKICIERSNNKEGVQSVKVIS